MNNPFEEIEARLSSIEILLLDLKNNVMNWIDTIPRYALSVGLLMNQEWRRK